MINNNLILAMAVGIALAILYWRKISFLRDSNMVIDDIVATVDPDENYQYLSMMPQETILIYKFHDLFQYNGRHYRTILQILDRIGYNKYTLNEKVMEKYLIPKLENAIIEMKPSIPIDKLRRYEEFKQQIISYVYFNYTS